MSQLWIRLTFLSGVECFRIHRLAVPSVGAPQVMLSLSRWLVRSLCWHVSHEINWTGREWIHRYCSSSHVPPFQFCKLCQTAKQIQLSESRSCYSTSTAKSSCSHMYHQTVEKVRRCSWSGTRELYSQLISVLQNSFSTVRSGMCIPPSWFPSRSSRPSFQH